MGLQEIEHHPPHIYIRFEEIITKPEAIIDQLTEFLDFEPKLEARQAALDLVVRR